MERHPVFIYWKAYFSMVAALKVIQIECNPYQNLNCHFYRNGKADPKIDTELQRALDSLNNLEKHKSR